MASFNMTIKDELLVKEIDAICASGGYPDTITDEQGAEIPNPMSKLQFTKNQVKAWMRNQAVEHANRIALMNVTVEEDI
jgi:hypothetical protein